MQKLTLTEFIACIKIQQNCNDFNQIAEQVDFFLVQKFDMSLILEFSTFLINSQLQLTLKQKFIGLSIYAARLSELSKAMIGIIVQYCENTFIDALKEILNQSQVTLKNIKIACQIINLYPKQLQKLHIIQQYCAFLIVNHSGSDQVKHITSSLFQICQIDKVLYYISFNQQLNPQHIFLFQYLDYYPQHLKLFFDRLLEYNSQHKLMKVLTQFEYFLIDSNHQYKQTSKALLSSFASLLTSSNPIIRRNCTLVLKYFPLCQQEDNAIVAQLNFLQKSLDDPSNVVRAVSAGSASQIIQKFNDIPNKEAMLQLLFRNSFDQDNLVRKSTVQALLAIIINNDKQAESLLKLNQKNFENLLYDNSSVRSSALKLYIQLLQSQALQPNPHILGLLNDQRIGFKLKFSALFPQGISSFISDPEFCYKQIFLAIKNCRNLIIPMLEQSISNMNLNKHVYQIAICGSISAILSAIFIELDDFSVIKLSIQARQKLFSVTNKERKVSEMTTQALNHSLNGMENKDFISKFNQFYKANRTPQIVILTCILQEWINLGFQMTISDINSLRLVLDDNTVNDCLDLGLLNLSIENVSKKVLNWINCIEVIGDIENYKINVKNQDINIRTCLVLLVDFLRQSVDYQKQNDVFILLNKIELTIDPFLIDLDKLLTIFIDIYLNQTDFCLTLNQTQSLIKFTDKIKLNYDSFPEFTQVICRRIDKSLTLPIFSGNYSDEQLTILQDLK